MNVGRICIIAFAAICLRAQDLVLAVGITPAQNIFNRIQGTFEKATGIHLVLKDARSPEAWRLLDAGQVEAASGGLTWEDWVASIKAKNLRVPSEEEITRFQIGIDQIQVVTSPDVLLLELGREELQGIFSGKTTNWKQVGGDDAPIVLLLDPTQIATNDTFRGQILGGAPFGPAKWTFPAGVTLVQAVAATSHSIGFAPKASQESLKVNSPVTPAITRPVLLVIKGKKPSASLRRLLDYLESPEGKQLTVR
ncbi:substrate-binding domain-containing protein [Geothrix sp. 21YS21S-2]|uniref:substrate-binding domain-containing protein n=1 Tax=Geothrix sp. 21YS21S-2 TaxID=3068893 RepID=UPI0027BA40C5|nr:substrate-binding domain-containing protein [Geothrix sp. 21YS21S-2]